VGQISVGVNNQINASDEDPAFFFHYLRVSLLGSAWLLSEILFPGRPRAIDNRHGRTAEARTA